MGYRERRAHKQQQAQEAFGKAYTSEQRTTLPAPQGYNYRDPSDYLQPNEARYIENASPSQYGLTIHRTPIKRVMVANTSGANATKGTLISYEASGCASSELWLATSVSAGQKIFDVGSLIDLAPTTGTASAGYSANGAGTVGDYTTFNKTVIFVNGVAAHKWTRASGWDSWSATASGDDIHAMKGITSFKNRLYTWKAGSDTNFWYSSTDQILGTFNSFDLGEVLNSNIKMVEQFTRDGGAGPDDFIMFIGENGRTAVYQGNDPSNADNWSLVGVYKIGRPVSRNAAVDYGQQVVILCEDDFYFIPEDLAGKKQSTKGVFQSGSIGTGEPEANALFWEKKGLLCFGDGSLIDVKRNYAHTNFTIDEQVAVEFGQRSTSRASIAQYKGKLYGAINVTGDVFSVYEMMPETGSIHKAKIITRPIPVTGRSVISLVNPVFGVERGRSSAGYNTGHNIRYRTAIVYDKEIEWRVTASAEAWITTSTSADSYGLWAPGFGDGHNAQFHIEVISASTSGELVLRRIDFTVSDTGGI